MRLPNIFKTTNVTNLTKVIQESSYRVLQVTSKTLKQTVCFLKAAEFYPTFGIQIDISLAIFREVVKTHFLESLQKSLKTR